MKSSLTVFGKKKYKRPKSSGNYSIKFITNSKRASITPRKSFASPKYTTAGEVVP